MTLTKIFTPLILLVMSAEGNAMLFPNYEAIIAVRNGTSDVGIPEVGATMLVVNTTNKDYSSTFTLDDTAAVTVNLDRVADCYDDKYGAAVKAFSNGVSYVDVKIDGRDVAVVDTFCNSFKPFELK